MEFEKEWQVEEKQMSLETVEHFNEFGRFAYLECLLFRILEKNFYESGKSIHTGKEKYY